MRQTKIITVALAAACAATMGVSAANVRATVLAGWNFYSSMNGSGTTSDGSVATVAATTVDSSVTTTAISRGSGMATAVMAGNFAHTGAMNANQPGNSNLAAAETANSYFQFTVTPTSTVSLSDLSFYAYQQNTNSPTGVGVLYSLDGFSSSGSYAGGSSANLGGDYQGTSYSVSLAGLSSLQNDSSPITFRIFLWGVGGYQDRGLGQVPSATAATTNDVELDGTAGSGPSIPEPATLGLMAVLGTGLLLVGRKRKVA